MKLWTKSAVFALSALSAASINAEALPSNAQLDVEFSLPTIETSMYARPYVAVWIEDSKRQPVRTLELWVGKDEWLKDLRSWWRKVGRYDKALVDGVTSATRPAGDYRFVWDGTDEKGNRVEEGNYTFYAEVVREHGGRNLLRQKIQLGQKGFSKTIEPTAETGVVTLSYKVSSAKIK
ncbi:DUF2271 domain-containing protein [Vibrio tapetis]|uniref:Putative exported protein n=1 Tax=Vibrio tapetis subsp. tapetis TaxID=1671868 RepID=A0A2N8ZCW9_9VIBR|nr:DUF2271 domain-containing protein [Vibrio tapetis]SON49751.1 putative exported protein [Vibrio tapetis subsp. tapetis]